MQKPNSPNDESAKTANNEPVDAPADAAGGAALADELAQSKDRYMRLMAEMENLRNRTRREMQDSQRYADFDLLSDLLPVIDNLQRAIEAGKSTTSDKASLLQGIELVNQQLFGVLAKHDAREIEAENKPFDPHFHQAILQQPSAEVPPGTVVMVTQSGYVLHDRVIRPAQVIVSSSPS